MTLPTKKDYDTFVDNLKSSFSRNFPEICFYLYGSYLEGRADYGRSDIDGGIILDENFITDKKRISKLAKILLNSMPKNKISFDLNLLDIGTCKDGRFLSYTDDFTDYFNQNGNIKVISGPDFVSEFKALNYKSGVLDRVAYNFIRRLRKNLLLSEIDIQNNPETFKENSKKSFTDLSALPKKLLWLLGQDINPIREKTYEKLTNIFEVKFPILEKSNNLLKKPQEFHELIENLPQALAHYKENLTCFEEILKTYVDRCPFTTAREAEC